MMPSSWARARARAAQGSGTLIKVLLYAILQTLLLLPRPSSPTAAALPPPLFLIARVVKIICCDIKADGFPPPRPASFSSDQHQNRLDAKKNKINYTDHLHRAAQVDTCRKSNLGAQTQ